MKGNRTITSAIFSIYIPQNAVNHERGQSINTSVSIPSSTPHRKDHLYLLECLPNSMLPLTLNWNLVTRWSREQLNSPGDAMSGERSLSVPLTARVMMKREFKFTHPAVGRLNPECREVAQSLKKARSAIHLYLSS